MKRLIQILPTVTQSQSGIIKEAYNKYPDNISQMESMTVSMGGLHNSTDTFIKTHSAQTILFSIYSNAIIEKAAFNIPQ